VKYLLSILAQLMRFQTMKKLKDVKRKMSKFRQTASSSASATSSSTKNQEINDEAILVWANQKGKQNKQKQNTNTQTQYKHSIISLNYLLKLTEEWPFYRPHVYIISIIIFYSLIS
jgi:hypothetical protein